MHANIEENLRSIPPAGGGGGGGTSLISFARHRVLVWIWMRLLQMMSAMGLAVAHGDNPSSLLSCLCQQ